MNRMINTAISLAPMPLFVAGAVYSYLNPSMCGAANEMLLMWVVMAMAHVSPWIMYWEQRRYRKIQHLPHKQQ
jgi:hypothetical protein